MSCGANIPPEWVNAIQRNECPGCGGEIMSGPTQELLKDLTEALERMPNDPQGVAGWLLSNYRFQKMGSGEPVEKFHRKGGGAPGGIDENNLKVDPTYNEFIRRNEASGLVARGEELAKLKHSQDGKLAEFASMIQSVGDPYGDDTTSSQSQEGDTASVDEQKAYLELKAAGFDPFPKNSAGGTGGGLVDLSQAINPQDVVNLMTQGQNAPLKEEMMLAQSQEGRNYLDRDRFKKMKAQDAISGGGGGAFRR
jgi:hypothetical protein